MPERSRDWIKQAEQDLKVAEELIKFESFEWSCFIAYSSASGRKISRGVMQKMQSFVVEESLNSVKAFWLDQEKLIEEIYKVAGEIGKGDENVLKIILFGSLAEKRGVPGSDADILIVLKRADKPFMDRRTEWTEKYSLDFPADIFSYTEKELNNNIPIALEAAKNGVTLFERQEG